MSVDVAALSKILNGIRSASHQNAAALASYGRKAIDQALRDGRDKPGEATRRRVERGLADHETRAELAISGGRAAQTYPDLAGLKRAVIACFVELNAVGEGIQYFDQIRSFARLWDDVKSSAGDVAEQAAAAASTIGIGLGAVLGVVAVVAIAWWATRRGKG